MLFMAALVIIYFVVAFIAIRYLKKLKPRNSPYYDFGGSLPGSSGVIIVIYVVFIIISVLTILFFAKFGQ